MGGSQPGCSEQGRLPGEEPVESTESWPELGDTGEVTLQKQAGGRLGWLPGSSVTYKQTEELKPPAWFWALSQPLCGRSHQEQAGVTGVEAGTLPQGT